MPAVLLAVVESPLLALYVILLYGGIQTVESYLLEPLVEHRTVALPPVLVIISQVLLGISLGVLGLVLATPLFAVAMVVIKMLYVEDALGDRSVAVAGEDEAQQDVPAASDVVKLAVHDVRRGPGRQAERQRRYATAVRFLERLGALDRVAELHGIDIQAPRQETLLDV